MLFRSQTLYEISTILDVSLSQLTDYQPEETPSLKEEEYDHSGISPFFKADRLYFYFYDGRYDRLKEAIIKIHKNILMDDGCYEDIQLKIICNYLPINVKAVLEEKSAKYQKIMAFNAKVLDQIKHKNQKKEQVKNF